MSVKDRRKIADNQVFHIKIGPNAEVFALLCRNLMSKTLLFSKYLSRSMPPAISKIWESSLPKKIFTEYSNKILLIAVRSLRADLMEVFILILSLL